MYPKSLFSRKLPLFAALGLVFGANCRAQSTVTYTTYRGVPGLSVITGITAGPDGALWFSGSGPSKKEVGRITTSGVITEYPTANTPGVIVAGPDGALWFTEQGVAQIGRITTTGAVTEYAIPSGGVAASMTAGPDGALWFTERNLPRIGRITTTGGVTEYAVPSLNSPGAGAITAGPDGALWFTDPTGLLGTCNGTDKIGRITTAGTVTEYALPACGRGGLGSLVAGSDGALWYSVIYPASIGRITTSGAITEYPFGAVPFDLIAGPDGALWFLVSDFEGDYLSLGRITTTGAISQYNLPPLNAASSSIANGPDNAVWIGDGGITTIFGVAAGQFVRAALGSALTITTASLPGGVNGTPYSANLMVQGGAPPYSWSVISGSLPAGLTLDSASGVISGVPSGPGTSFTVRVADGSAPALSATQTLSISISTPSSAFSVATLPSGLAMVVDGASYIAPQSFTCAPGTQHTLTVNSPQFAGIPGFRYIFTNWSDGVNTANRQVTCSSTSTTYTANFKTQYVLSTTVLPAGAGSIVVTPSSPDGYYDSGVSVQLTASSGFVSWSGDLSGATNPQSLVMNSSKSVKANFATASSLTIVTTSLPTGSGGTPYSGSLTASGGIPPYAWSVTSGSLPGGLSLNTVTGVISGTPTGVSANFTVQVTDSSSPPQSATQALSIIISNGLFAPGSTFTVASAPTGLAVMVDGLTYATPHAFVCDLGSVHVLTAVSPQPSSTVGVQFAFAGWSDGTPTATRQITCVPSSATYTAYFGTQSVVFAIKSPPVGAEVRSW